MAELASEVPLLNQDELSMLAEIQERELSVTSAILECNGIPGLENLRSQIRVEREKVFLEENEGALLAFIDQD